MSIYSSAHTLKKMYRIDEAASIRNSPDKVRVQTLLSLATQAVAEENHHRWRLRDEDILSRAITNDAGVRVALANERAAAIARFKEEHYRFHQMSAARPVETTMAMFRFPEEASVHPEITWHFLAFVADELGLSQVDAVFMVHEHNPENVNPHFTQFLATWLGIPPTSAHTLMQQLWLEYTGMPTFRDVPSHQHHQSHSRRPKRVRGGTVKHRSRRLRRTSA